jgi:hypothetical protein
MLELAPQSRFQKLASRGGQAGYKKVFYFLATNPLGTVRIFVIAPLFLILVHVVFSFQSAVFRRGSFSRYQTRLCLSPGRVLVLCGLLNFTLLNEAQ